MSSAVPVLSSLEEYSTHDVMFFIIDLDGLKVVQSLLDVTATHCLASMISLTVLVFSLFLSFVFTRFTLEKQRSQSALAWGKERHPCAKSATSLNLVFPSLSSSWHIKIYHWGRGDRGAGGLVPDKNETYPTPVWNSRKENMHNTYCTFNFLFIQIYIRNFT